VTIVYGPVPSWRLGRSLGIDLTQPPKTCTFDCVYCQLGRTINKVSNPEEFVTKVGADDFEADLKKALRSIGVNSLDYITFSGTGEPTLNLKLGEMIKRVKEIARDVPVAVLTNSSLVNREDVRANLAEADLVVAKLDAPHEALFKAINRPAEGLTLESIIEGLKRLRSQKKGKMALQLMFLKTTQGSESNADPKNIDLLVELVRKIGPDEVQINTPTRPPSEKYVLPLSGREIDEIAAKFRAALKDVEILAWTAPKAIAKAKREVKDVKGEIVATLERRPCRFQDLVRALGVDEETVNLCIEQLQASKVIAAARYHGEVFYQLTRRS